MVYCTLHMRMNICIPNNTKKEENLHECVDRLFSPLV